MHMRHISSLLAVLAFVSVAAQAEPTYIAGVNPSERPAAAPTLTEVEKDAAWYDLALHGVKKPYPASLRFLEDQGNWFTPFNHSGMLPRYDVRGWHSSTE